MEKIKGDKLLTILTSVLFLGGALTIGWALYRAFQFKAPPPAPVNMDCVQSTQLHSMRQPDMGKLLEKTRQFKILVGYFDCNPPQRGDLVAFQSGEAELPLVRVVRGIPGDRVELSATEGDHWEIVVNGDPAVEAGAQVRWSPPTTPPPLSEKLASQEGILGEDEYLLLAVTRLGESDSVVLGPASKAQIIGMVMVLPPTEP